MRRFAVLLGVLSLAACAKSDSNATADSAAASMMPAPLSLADVAGKWSVKVMPQNSDSVLLTYELTASADMAGWSIKLPDRADPLAVRVVAVEGDSVVVEAGPYPSALRPNVQVSTRGVSRLQGGMLVGATTAHYTVTTADSVVTLRTQGARIP